MKQAWGGEEPGDANTAAAIVPDGVLVQEGIVEGSDVGFCLGSGLWTEWSCSYSCSLASSFFYHFFNLDEECSFLYDDTD